MSTQPYTDNSKMPFGMHKDKPLANVPDEYLVYIYDKGWCDKYPQLKKYIIDNMDSLKKK